MKYKINLLGQRINKGDFLKKFTYFSSNYLRYILVFTQLIVISVLFFRFAIDQKILDLKDTIIQQEEIIKSVKPIIDESEIIDFKIKNIKKLIKEQDKYKNQIDYILSRFPSTVFLSSFSITDTTLSMEGLVSNPNHLQSFFNRLKREKKYSDINLSEIKKTENAFSFTLTLNNYKE